MPDLLKPLAVAALFVGPPAACAHHQSTGERSAAVATAGAERGSPLILAAEEGEHRVRRIGGVSRFTIKIDPVTAHSRDLVMVSEAIPPNGRIPPHVHPSEDEIVFIHAGSGMVELGNQRAAVSTGATIYIPRATRISLRNNAESPLEIVAIFSHSGFEEYLRGTSVVAGDSAAPMTSAELQSLRQRHAAHVIWERP